MQLYQDSNYVHLLHVKSTVDCWDALTNKTGQHSVHNVLTQRKRIIKVIFQTLTH